MMTCRICSSPDRAGIDKALVEGRSLRDIAGQYAVHRSSLDRHKAHIAQKLTKAKQAEQVTEATSLLSRVEGLMSRCETIYERALKAGKWMGAAAAAREIRGCLELLGKLQGELQSSRVTITLATIQNLDVAALSREQVCALYERVQAEGLRSVRQLSDSELDAEIKREIERLYPDRVPKMLLESKSQVIEGT